MNKKKIRNENQLLYITLIVKVRFQELFILVDLLLGYENLNANTN